MQRNLICTVSGFLLFAPVGLDAAEMGGSVTLGFSKSDISVVPNDLKTTTLDMNGYYDVGNGLSFGMNAALARIDITGGAPDLDANYFGLDGKYRFSNGFAVGAYVERGHVKDSAGLLLGSVTLTSYGLTLGYETDDLSAEVYYGVSDTKPSLPAGIDIKDFGARVQYDFAPNAFGVGAIGRTRIEGAGNSVDIDLVSLGGGYSFNDSLMAYGGAQRASIGLVNVDVTTFGLGLAYKTAAISGIPTVLSLELARSTLDTPGPSVDIDTVRFGVTIPLGKSKSHAPLNSVVNGIQNGGHSVVTSGVLGAF